MENNEVQKALIDLYLSLNSSPKIINSEENKVNYIYIILSMIIVYISK